MFKRFISSLAVAAFLFIGLVSPIQAKTLIPARPATATDCTSGCTSWFAWNGTTYGAYGQFETTSSSITFHNTGRTLRRLIAAFGGTNGQWIHNNVGLGEEIDSPNWGVCNASNGTQAAYFYVEVTDNTGNIIGRKCWLMAAADQNKMATFQIGQYVSNGGGMQMQIWGFSGSHDVFSQSFASGAGSTYSSMGFQEDIWDNVTGHEVWGVYNQQWKYLNSGLSFNYQQRAVDYMSVDWSGYGPPQLYWITTPASGNNGGQAISCDYENDQGPNCTHGG